MPTGFQRLLLRLQGRQRWARAFLLDGDVIGFLVADGAAGGGQGMIYRPVVARDNEQHLPAMLNTALEWLGARNQTRVRLALSPSQENELALWLNDSRWSVTQRWIRLHRQL